MRKVGGLTRFLVLTVLALGMMAGVSAEWNYTGTSYNISDSSNQDVLQESDGTGYILDGGDDIASEYDSSWTDTGVDYSIFEGVGGIDKGNSGNFYNGFYGGSKVAEFDSNWENIENHSLSDTGNVRGVTQDSNGDFWVVDYQAEELDEYSNSWNYKQSINVSSETDLPGDVEWADGSLYMPESTNSRVIKYDPTDGSIIATYNVSSEDTTPLGVYYSPYSERFLLSGYDNKKVFVYSGFNQAPEFNSTSISPDPPEINKNVSYSAEVYDPDGNISYTNLTVEFNGSTVVSDEKRTGTTPSWNDVYEPGSGDKWLNATFVTVDDAGATNTTEINRFVEENPPKFEWVNTTPETWEYGDSVSVDTNVSEGDNPVSSVNATVYENGSTIKQDVSLSDSDSDGIWTVSDLFTVNQRNTEYTIELTAEDTQGLTSQENRSQFIEIDVVTIHEGVTIHQSSNNLAVNTTSSFNVSYLETYSDKTNFGGVNFSILNGGGDPVDLFLSYFDDDATEPEYVANYSADTVDGNEVTFQFDGLVSNSLYRATRNGDMVKSEESGSNGNFSFINSEWAQLQNFTLQNSDNIAPSLGIPFYREDRKQDVQRIVFDVDDKGEGDISAWKGPGTEVVFSNSSLSTSVSLPVTGIYNVSDVAGAVSNNRSVQLSQSDSGVREDDFSHTLDTQRKNQTVELVNDAGESLDYNLTLASHGATVIQGVSWNGSIPSNDSITHTGIWESDYITGEKVETVEEGPDTEFDHTEDQQRIKNQSELVVNNTGGLNFSSVNVTTQCENTATTDISAGDKVVATSNCTSEIKTGDFINVSLGNLSQDDSHGNSLDSQGLKQEKSLIETKGYNWSRVNVSAPSLPGNCVNCAERLVNVTAESTIQEFYNSTGDWVVNESNQSTEFGTGKVVVGEDIRQNYTAVQNVEAANKRNDLNLSVNFSKRISNLNHCNTGNQVGTVPANSSSSFEFDKDCRPGQVLNQEPIEKTETATEYVYTYRASFEVFTNLTEEEPQKYAVKKSRLSNWENRKPEDTEKYIDGKEDGLTLDQQFYNETEYVVIEIPDNFGNSSLHSGNHSAKLVYYESKSTGGGTGGGTVTSSETETVENVTGEYNWTVSAAVSTDMKKFTVARAPGDRFNKTVVLENTGTSEVPLNISCVSQDGFCRYVGLEVDRVVLNTGSFSQKQLTVSGNVPANASTGSSYTFRVLVEDPSSTGLGSDGAATVDFLVSASNVWGTLINSVEKLTEWRELEPPFSLASPISYPFVIAPIGLGGLTWFLLTMVQWAAKAEPRTSIQVAKFTTAFVVALVAVPLL